ncbi:ATP-binding protein [Tenacibaculum dicentrarchi]|uniref:ATP-binding protein n=1 Tax=Tenacibaculum dicentrarchi TaxID=669041 RepID=UPI001E4BA5EB|nr:ATP-binding protein [Tenacibaculum dicentrarchi]
MKKSFEKEFIWEQYFIVSGNVIRQKESSEIEFKESFHSPKHKDKKLHKWIASFANNNGGLILYGIKDNGELIGLQNNKLEEFDNKDLSEELLSYFAPEINFELFIKEINGLKIGFLYIHKSKNKPIITIKTANNNIQEGDIFYRYPGQSRKISYGDLKNIIEEKQNLLNERWLKLINDVASIGVENIGLLNIENGELIGSKNKLLIPEELLNKVTFINEGTFVEKDGTPALKLIGDVQPVDSKKIIQLVENKYHIITHFELFSSFFEQDLDVDSAKEFLRKVTHENSVYYPIYFYIKKSQLTKSEVYNILDKEKGNKVKDVEKRLSTEENKITKFINGNISSGTPSAEKIQKAYDNLKAEKNIDFSNIESSDLRYYIQAITHLKKEEINISYIISVLKNIYDKYFNKSSTTKSIIRKAICHIDLTMYGEDFFKNEK